MPTLAEILQVMPLPAMNASPDNWTNLFEERLRIENRLKWPDSEEPGTVGDFVGILEGRLNQHPNVDNMDYRLNVLLAFYRYFYKAGHFSFQNDLHRLNFLETNGLRDAIGKTIDTGYFRLTIRDKAKGGVTGMDVLNDFNTSIPELMAETELFKVVCEKLDQDLIESRDQQFAENLNLDAVSRYFRAKNIQNEKKILLLNYLKCFSGIEPFRRTSNTVWENTLLRGVAVNPKIGTGNLIKAVSVNFIPKLERSQNPVKIMPDVLNAQANRALTQVLLVIEKYDNELHDLIKNCDVHITIAAEGAGNIEGDSITLFLALIIFMQATGTVWQAIDDVQVVVTGDVEKDTGILCRVDYTNTKTKIAIDSITHIGEQKQLLMLVPEENRAEALSKLAQATNIKALLHGGVPQTPCRDFSKDIPSIEIVSYRDLEYLLLGRCLIDFPGLVISVFERRYGDWNDQVRDHFNQVLVDTTPQPIEYNTVKTDQKDLQEIVREDWLNRQPIFMNKQDSNKAQKMKIRLNDVENLIEKKEYDNALNILNQLQQVDDIDHFWKKKTDKFIQQIRTEKDKLVQLRGVVNNAFSVLSSGKALKFINNVLQKDVPEALKIELQDHQNEIKKRSERQKRITTISGVAFIIVSVTFFMIFRFLSFTSSQPSFDMTETKKTVRLGQTVSLAVTMKNPSGSPLEYEWKAEYGQIKPSNLSPTIADYTAPNSIIEDTVILKVKSNGKDIFVSKPIKVFVSAP